jgi:hypothetical protein
MEELNMHMSAMGNAFMSSPEEVAKGVVKSIKRDKAEIVIMPGPGRLLRALMDLFPGMGSMMGQMSAPQMKQIANFREQQRIQGDMIAHQPAQER